MKHITKFKRLFSGVLSAVMAVSAVPIVSVHAEENSEPYPYTMFASSSDDGAITVNADNFCVNGNVVISISQIQMLMNTMRIISLMKLTSISTYLLRCRAKQH